jgi:hypothetical protein
MGLVALLLVLIRKACKRPSLVPAKKKCPFAFLTGSKPAEVESTPTEPGLGWKEYFIDGSPEAEAAFIQGAMDDIHGVQALNKDRGQASNYGRAFHAKIQGGVKNAVFRIAADLPKELAVGFFQPGKEYATAVRLSNASGVIQDDNVRDLRGIAARVDVGNGEFHDYLATNGLVSHARNARQFIQFAKAGAGSRLLMFPRLFFSVGPCEMVRMLRTVVGQTKRQPESLAKEIYWSRAAYLIGARALKFQFTPNTSTDVNVGRGPSYLREDLVERLKRGPVVLDFQVQLFKDEESTPIEDGAVEWKTPLVTVAQLIIPQQDLDSAEAKAAQAEVEAMEFNPWNTTPDFRPLGSLNRARRLVYKASVALRKGLVSAKRKRRSCCCG